MKEMWKPVPVEEFAAKYEVSNLGRVRNATKGNILTPMMTGQKRLQYQTVRFSSNPRKDFKVHWLVLTAFVGAKSDGLLAMHLDNDTTNNRVDNLKWGTLSDNVQHMLSCCRGGSQKLTVEQREEIRKRRMAGEIGSALGREYGVSPQTVCDIYKGRS